MNTIDSTYIHTKLVDMRRDINSVIRTNINDKIRIYTIYQLVDHVDAFMNLTPQIVIDVLKTRYREKSK
jgi:hypothetical protein